MWRGSLREHWLGRKEAAAQFGESPSKGQQIRFWSSAAICAVCVNPQEDVSHIVRSCEQEEVRQKLGEEQATQKTVYNHLDLQARQEIPLASSSLLTD